MSEQERIGIIRVSALVLDEMGIAIKTEHGICEDTGTFATVKERLLLPEHYTITGIFMYPVANLSDRRMWGIFVESPELPVLDPQVKWPPNVTPIYTRSADGQVQLVEIKVEDL